MGIRLVRLVQKLWHSPRLTQWRTVVIQWRKNPIAGLSIAVVGTVLATLLIIGINHEGIALPNPGLIYLPLVAMLAYHWGWREAVLAGILQLLYVYVFFVPPLDSLKPLTAESTAQLVTLAAVTGFVLALVQLARQRRSIAEQAASRFAALNRIGTALTKELDEARLLHLIAQTARDLTGAEFAAFTLRPVNELGQPLVPSEGNLFHLAAVVGVTQEQEALFRRMPLGGEGLLAPIFRYGVPVRVPDAIALIPQGGHGEVRGQRAALSESRETARQVAFAYAHGQFSSESLHSLGVPRGHPIVRSFLGTPLLDHTGQVRGGLLLGHSRPDQFTQEDEALLVGLAAQAAVALENARLYRAAQMQAQELDTLFESIADGISLINDEGKILRENRTARRLRETLEDTPEGLQAAEKLLHASAERVLHGESEQGIPLTILDASEETRHYVVSASSLRQPSRSPGTLSQSEDSRNDSQESMSGAVVVWHDVTEARRLGLERLAHAETEARRALLQTLIDELPSSVYLVRGKDAHLVLANRTAATVWGASWAPGQAMSQFLVENGIRIFAVDGHPLAPEELATLRAVGKGETVHQHQEVIRHRDGTTLPVIVNAVPLAAHLLNWSQVESTDETDDAVGEDGLGAIVVHQDVTALKEAERLKDEFIGIAAHELRSPLAVLKGFTQMLLVQTARGKGSQLADWQLEALEDIDRATTRLVELTEDLLDVSRIQAGKLELHIEPTDLVALVQRMVKRLQVTAEQHMLALSTTEEHLIVQADPKRMEQVLTNLVNNAIKYSPEGGKVDIVIRADQKARAVTLCVHDVGIGIPLAQQAQIFGRFVRADNARSIGGTGLGLYLCREIVERHEGHIWFESVEGQGSTFYIDLPLVLDTPMGSSAQVDSSKV